MSSWAAIAWLRERAKGERVGPLYLQTKGFTEFGGRTRGANHGPGLMCCQINFVWCVGPSFAASPPPFYTR